ncbi:MAG: transcriptional regulator [Rhizobiaceae bacterium]|nr:transcriptional regulator [Rhizobiaceae bacterium]MCV0405437.1 transcriptional regulator [Rhizobiaceae bacterium]
MALTKDFRQTVKARADRDAAFRAELLVEAVNLLLAGDITTGKSLLRTYVNATIGFESLADDVGIPSKSLMRMLSEKGNPRAEHLFAIIRVLQSKTGVSLEANAA